MIPSVKEIFATIAQSKNILIVAHARPDGDTLGSTLAMAHFCANENLKFTLLCADAPADYFSHLPKIKDFTQWIPSFTMFDTIICLDHGDPKLSKFGDQIMSTKVTGKVKVLNIDHHVSNSNYGDINYVVSDRSSTCELLYLMFLQAGIKVNKEMAICLMTGLITDTGHFSNSATKASSLEVAADLVRLGAKMPDIASQVMGNKTVSSLNLWGDIFSRLTITPENKIAYTVITQDDLNKPGVDKESVDGLIGFLTGIKEASLVMVLIQEDPKTIKGSLRTLKDDVDVSAIASQWGGGGHRKASGFKLEGKLVEKNGVWDILTSGLNPLTNNCESLTKPLGLLAK